MKRPSVLFIAILFALVLCAQDQKKFSPEKFEAELEGYIVKEADLTPQEAEKFLPLYKEMRQKQRTIYGRQHKAGKQRPADEAACADAVKQNDRLNIELKQIEQRYHERMLKTIPASKVYETIKAENRFHRHMMKNWQRQGGKTTGRQKDKRR